MTMTACRVCGSGLQPFLDLGQMPLSGRFRRPDDAAPEPRFPLVAALCAQCGLVQLVYHPPPEEMFREDYTFFSSTSKGMAAHFDRLAAALLADAPPAPFVVEVGCNDGVLLSAFARRGARVLGVDPAGGAVAKARAAGHMVEQAFFGPALAATIAARDGRADLIVATNALTHIPDLPMVFEAVRLLLADRGRLVIEDPWWPATLRRNAFDQIYDEHVFYFSAGALAALGRRYRLTLVDCLPQPVHGGSMRYVLSADPDARPGDGAARVIAAECRSGAGTLEGCRLLARAAERARRELPRLLRRLASEGRPAVGYGATAKSATLLNYCGIDRDLLPWIADTTPSKQGRLSPGTGILVAPHTRFQEEAPDAALLLAWNHAAEIGAKEADFTARRGRWVVHVPHVRELFDLSAPLFADD